MNGIDSVSDVFERDVLTCEDMRDVEEAVVPADGAIATDAAEFKVSRVLEDRQVVWEDRGGGAIEVGRDVHA